MEDDTKKISINVCGRGNNEGEPLANPMVADFEDNGEEDVSDNEFGKGMTLCRLLRCQEMKMLSRRS
ncbi:hypothetical protein L195_g031999 [Trifolium pratense]|uniref:Uncharacterized protein n=1 Tax=Trifolium pratense TaxID=57577 RepID=A0A2K3LC21_TRIPR|nr:hypothetical protein L195_g031999 [Trifolium pratense]